MTNDTATEPHTRLRAHHLPTLREYVKDGIRLHWDESTGYTLAFAQAHDAVLDAIAREVYRLNCEDGAAEATFRRLRSG